jgi:hypothetical protein
MTSAELTEWAAYERVYGSIVPHERIDAGFAQLSWLMAYLWGKKKHGEFKIREFMPPWYQELTKGLDRRPDAIRQAFEKLMGMAEAK